MRFISRSVLSDSMAGEAIDDLLNEDDEGGGELDNIDDIVDQADADAEADTDLDGAPVDDSEVSDIGSPAGREHAAAIGAAVKSGTYRVDPVRVAHQMLRRGALSRKD